MDVPLHVGGTTSSSLPSPSTITTPPQATPLQQVASSSSNRRTLPISSSKTPQANDPQGFPPLQTSAQRKSGVVRETNKKNTLFQYTCPSTNTSKGISSHRTQESPASSVPEGQARSSHSSMRGGDQQQYHQHHRHHLPVKRSRDDGNTDEEEEEENTFQQPFSTAREEYVSV